MAPIGVAIIGGGIWTRMHHLPAVLDCPDLALKAIYSRSLKSAQATAADIPAPGAAPDLYSSDSGAGRSYADLLARPDVGAVIVCVPILEGPGLAEEALRAGKHVFAEKPIAGDVARAKALMAEYARLRGQGSGATFCVAENFRFMPSLAHAFGEARKLGELKGFYGTVVTPTPPDSIWMATEWRKKPSHQGGFVLDAGTHYVAAIRGIVGQESPLDTVIAYTAQVQPHLPPLDTVHSVLRTKSGVIGTLSISAGLNTPGQEYAFSFSKGSILIKDSWKKVRVTTVGEDGKEESAETEFSTEMYGVKEEVAAWGEALASGKPNPLQSPEEALADLEVLEKIFRSGEQSGKEQKLELQ